MNGDEHDNGDGNKGGGEGGKRRGGKKEGGCWNHRELEDLCWDQCFFFLRSKTVKKELEGTWSVESQSKMNQMEYYKSLDFQAMRIC